MLVNSLIFIFKGLSQTPAEPVGEKSLFPHRKWICSNFLNFQPILIKIELETGQSISSWFPAFFLELVILDTP